MNEHDCYPPTAQSVTECWECPQCGLIWQFDEVSELWETVGQIEAAG